MADYGWLGLVQNFWLNKQY